MAGGTPEHHLTYVPASTAVTLAKAGVPGLDSGVTPSKDGRLTRTLLAGVIALIAGAAVYTSVLIVERQSALRSVSRYNVTWLVSQAATELGKLQQRVTATAFPGSGVDEDEIQLWLDVLANRVGLLRSGEVAEFTRTDPAIAAIVDQVAAVVDQARPLADSLARPGTALQLYRLLGQLDVPLSRLAVAANAHAGTQVDADQRDLSRLHWMFSALLLALLACGGLLLALLSRSRRALQATGADLASANAAVRAANHQLQQRNAALQDRDQELLTQNQRFEAALDNMSQALCMVGPDGRLIVCNRRFLQLFGLGSAMARPGTDVAEVWRRVSDAGQFQRALTERMFAQQSSLIGGRELSGFFHEDTDGRAVSVSHQPMLDGGWVATYEDISDRRRTEARISFMAHHDALTSLPNRVLFREHLEYALTNARRGTDGGFAVFCLDLDRFKDVNDTLGHHVGDMLLEVVAQRLRECVRGSDTVARLGGDEFAILQVGSDQPAAAEALAGRLTTAIAAPYDLAGHRVHVSVSGGITLCPDDGSSSERLLKNADMALYQAKGDGRSHICFYKPEMEARLQARRLIEVDLAVALQNGEFEVYYHPLVALQGEQVAGFEALLRWHHPHGMIQPSHFIPIAEDTGLIVAIGDWVLRQACKDAVQWPPHIRVSVNLSSVQFRGKSLIQSVADALAESGLPAGRLELEVTESVLLADNEANVEALHELQALGVRISMDDFGTGYSSLSYLRQFPFNNIKIDQSFIREMVRSPDCIAIVTSIASLAVSLGMTTTAEGVETAEHLHLARQAGCTEVQGFLFGRPKPSSEVDTSGMRTTLAVASI